MTRTPLVVDIKRYSMEDGPGIRSVVFFKGCPLRCSFCQNPETQDPRLELAFTRSRCIECGSCAGACAQGAIGLGREARIDRTRCNRCGKCTEVCLAGALRRIGTYYSPGALAEILLRDESYYRHSGGGVTFSGGECTLYPEYLEEVLALLEERDVHVALQTSGCFDYDRFSRRILPRVDLIYFDVKLAEAGAHQFHTGRSNERILENLRRLVTETKVKVEVTVPLVPGVTATKENLRGIVQRLAEIGASTVSLQPYNPLGVHMTESLGRPAPQLSASFMKPDELEHVHGVFREILHEQFR